MYCLCVFGLVLIGTTTVLAGVQNDVLNYHNQYRRRHGAAPLILDSKLSGEAQKYAMYLAKRGGDLVHSRNRGNTGENLAYSKGYPNAPKLAVDNWYNEKRFYRPHGFTMQTGHFTQVVWKGSKKLGVGVATVNGKTYTVCRYQPAGNVHGQFPQNVQI